MPDREALYARLPIPLQNIACSLEGLRIQLFRFGRSFPHIRTLVEQRGELSEEEYRAFRDARLRGFLMHAAATVPYYRDHFQHLGLDVREIRSLDDLSALPLLEKSDVRGHARDLVSDSVARRDQMLVHTSGTTGGGLHFWTTQAAVREQWATYWRYWRWHGIDPGEKCAYFTGRSVVPLTQCRPPFWRYDVPRRRILFSGYHMSPANLPAYVDEARRQRPAWLHGYPSLIVLLASHLIEARTDLGYEVRWITTAAENLLPHQSTLIERALGVRPRQHYGSTEAVAQFSECELGALHVDEDFAAVEFVADGQGQTRIIGTNFSNLATPLIRYDVGDLARTNDEACPCGRPGRLVTAVDGRLEDYVVLNGGARVGRLDHVFKDMLQIREAQIQQRLPGAISVQVVRTPDYGVEDERRLLRELWKRLGQEMVVNVEYVESVPRTSTGKLRLVVSELEGASLARLGAKGR